MSLEQPVVGARSATNIAESGVDGERRDRQARRHARAGERVRRIRASLDGLKFRVEPRRRSLEPGRDTYYPRTTLMGSQVNGQAVRGQDRRRRTSSTRTRSRTTTRSARTTRSTRWSGYSRQQNDLENSTIQNSNFVSDIDVFEIDRRRHADRRPAGFLGAHALDAGVVPRTHQLHARSTATSSRSRAAATARRASAPITSGASSRRRRSDGA